tara:strand:- start:1240 stop:1983 length:744 start_codon:yes stop_codon:yes gene_type:complete
MNQFDEEQQHTFDNSTYGATDPVYPELPIEIKTFKSVKECRTDNLYEYFPVWFEELSEIEGVYLAGGALRNMLGGDDYIADIDIFFRDQEALDKAMEVMSMYEGSEDGCWYKAFQCPAKELITYKSAIECLMYGEEATEKDYKNQRKVQFITKSFYPTPHHLISTFDFIPTCACLYQDVLYTHKDWVRHVKKRTLGLNFISYPVASIYRMMKYKDKGYHVLTDTVLGMVLQINEGDFEGDRLALYID